MDKKILKEYTDACALIKETEEDIWRLKRKQRTVVQDRVRGSASEFPYTEKSYHIEGIAYSSGDERQLRMEEALLIRRKENAERIKMEVEEFVNTLPARMQRIIRFRIMQKLSWDEAAAKMGNGATAESLRKELDRFMGK